MLFSKYEISRHGWLVRDPLPWFSSIWKGIVAVKDIVMKKVRYRVGKGDKVHF